MAKKFFYNRVYSTKKLIVNIIVIVLCIVGIILCFVFTSHFQGKNNNIGQLDLKTETIVEVNQDFSKEIFFTNILNVNLDNVDIKYPEDYSISKTGKYDVLVTIGGKNYNTVLIVADTQRPDLLLKNVTILENQKYQAKDFISSCVDNSNEKCIIEFYNEGLNEEGEITDYSNYNKSGIYPIKISAKDNSGNITIKETNLTINKSNSNPIEKKPTSLCKYGNDVYDKEKFVLAVKVATNGCAINIDLWKDAGKHELDQITDSEITKIKQDLRFKDGKPSITRQILTIFNSTKTGIVGYELKFIVKVSINNKTETILEYKVDENGKRIYSNEKEI